MGTTRAQIGVYESSNTRREPIAILTRDTNGFPTGEGGVMNDLVPFVSETLAKAKGTYDAEHILAHLVHRFIAAHEGVIGYKLGHEFRGECRFYYAVTPKAVSVYDAREMKDLSRLPEPMFATEWLSPERIKELEEEVATLQVQLREKQGELKAVKSKYFVK